MSQDTPIDPQLVDLAVRLLDLAREGATRELASYVDAGVPVDLANERGDTLLMLAAYHGHLDTVTELLSRGADPNLINDRGQTPLAGAIFKGREKIVRALLDAGADPHAGSPTAVETAHMFGRPDLLPEL